MLTNAETPLGKRPRCVPIEFIRTNGSEWACEEERPWQCQRQGSLKVKAKASKYVLDRPNPDEQSKANIHSCADEVKTTFHFELKQQFCENHTNGLTVLVDKGVPQTHALPGKPTFYFLSGF